MTVRGLPINLGWINAPGLTSLTLKAHGTGEGHLPYADIAKICSFTSLRRLELRGWRDYDSLGPLGWLDIEQLVCEDLFMLLDMLAPQDPEPDDPPALQSLKAVTLQFHRRKHWRLWGSVPERLIMKPLGNGKVCHRRDFHLKKLRSVL